MTDITISQEDLDKKLADAAATAVEGHVSKSEMDTAIQAAVSTALNSQKGELEAEKQAALAKERSKKEEINERLKKANKKQVPAALEGLDDDLVEPLIKAADHIKGLSTEKRLMFLENISSGNFTDMVAQQRQTWKSSELDPIQTKLEEANAKIAELQSKALRSQKETPIRDALLNHCNPDPEAQKDAYRRMWDAFEDVPDDEGKLKPKQIGPTMGVCPTTNQPFTPETYAKHLAGTISYFAKPSSTSVIGGNGSKPTTAPSNLSLEERMSAAPNEEERKRIFREHRKALKGG